MSSQSRNISKFLESSGTNERWSTRHVLERCQFFIDLQDDSADGQNRENVEFWISFPEILEFSNFDFRCSRYAQITKAVLWSPETGFNQCTEWFADFHQFKVRISKSSKHESYCIFCLVSRTYKLMQIGFQKLKLCPKYYSNVRKSEISENRNKFRNHTCTYL